MNQLCSEWTLPGIYSSNMLEDTLIKVHRSSIFQYGFEYIDPYFSICTSIWGFPKNGGTPVVTFWAEAILVVMVIHDWDAWA